MFLHLVYESVPSLTCDSNSLVSVVCLFVWMLVKSGTDTVLSFELDCNTNPCAYRCCGYYPSSYYCCSTSDQICDSQGYCVYSDSAGRHSTSDFETLTLTHSFTHPFIHSFTRSLIPHPLFTHSLNSLIHSFTRHQSIQSVNTQ